MVARVKSLGQLTLPALVLLAAFAVLLTGVPPSPAVVLAASGTSGDWTKAVMSWKERPLRPGQKPITITLWDVWDGPRHELAEKVVKDFEAAYPWIKVNRQFYATGAITAKFTTALAGGAPPDVVMLPRTVVPQFIDAGALAPLDSFMNERKISKEIFFPADIGSFIVNGKTWALPTPSGGATNFLVIYNRDRFEEVGLPDRAPLTWQELATFSRKLVEFKNGQLVRYGANLSYQSQLFLPMLYSNAGQYISRDLRKITFDSAEGVEALEFAVNFTNQVNRGKDQVANLYARHGTPFYVGVEAIWWTNVSAFFWIDERAKGIRYGVGSMPYNAENPKAESHGVVEGGWGYVLPETGNEARKYAAFLLLEWFTVEREGAGWFMLQQKRPSPVIAYNLNPDYLKLNPLWPQVIKVMERDVSIPITPVHPDIQQAYYTAWNQAMAGELSPQDALKQAAAKAQQRLDEYWKSRR
ncbi:MAG: extracellular solute-binding protein [Limnochordales bacterium]|nr:extracellular solute-binding protein [Limnochordales bacterium]